MIRRRDAAERTLMTEPLETYRGAVYPWHMDRAARKSCAFPDDVVAAGRRLAEAAA